MKFLKFILVAICEAIIMGLIVRETDYETGILVMLVMIYARLSIIGEE